MCRTLFENDSVVFDIGANLGLSAFGFSAMCDNGKVYAFEPSPTIFGFLKENIKINCIENCSLHNIALSNNNGFLNFHASEYGAGSHIVGDYHPESGEISLIKVPAFPLDYFVETNNINRIDLIKIDVEGHEPEVLQGGRNSIKKFKPKIIMGFNSWRLAGLNDKNPGRFLSELIKDYDAFRISGDSLEQITIENTFKFLHDNFTQHGCIDDLLLIPR